ncbi:MAG: lytic transglycosylase domain-containing protein, partial [Caulobacteraceae bacterium]|nr:lytic transglycosylase domain-containing protein [Caulobacteraceae bacterium]
MLATSLAALLAALSPFPQTTADLNRQGTPYLQSGTIVPTAGYQPRVLNEADTALFRQGLAAARARDVAGTRNAIASIGDPTARKLVEWALIDTSAEMLSFAELSEDVRSMQGWPREEARLSAGERALDRAGVGPDAALAFFGDRRPVTVEGAIALADAWEQRGRTAEARALIGEWWRTRSFDAAVQTRILGRWGAWLTQADHEA